MEDSEIGDAADLRHLVHHLGRELLEHLKIGADDLHGIGALHARERLLDVVLDILREVEADARQFLGEFLLQLFRQLFLGQVRRPFVERLEGSEQFHIGERRGVTAVVGAAVLRHHGDHFRVTQQYLAHLAGDGGAGIERHRRRHRGADPEIALLQRRQKLAAETRGREHAQAQKDETDRHRYLEVGQRPAQHRRITLAQQPHDDGLGLLDVFRQQQRGQNRRHREGGEQRTGERVTIRPRHRPENLALDTLHRE